MPKKNKAFFWMGLITTSFMLAVLVLELTAWCALNWERPWGQKLSPLSLAKLYQAERDWTDWEEGQKARWYKNPQGPAHPYFDNDVGKVPHPYLGFIHARYKDQYLGVGLPYGPGRPRPKDDFVIAVLGGSLSSHLCQHLQKWSQRDELEILLGKKRGQKTIWLCTAASSDKQPQSFSLLAHYGKYFDATINLDGFNEITDDSYPAYPFDFPHFSAVFFPRDHHYGRDSLELGKRAFQEQFIGQLGNFLSRPPLGYSSTLFLLWKALDSAVAKSMSQLQLLEKASARSAPWPPLDRKQRAQAMAQLWQEFSLKQWWLSQQLKLPSFFFLQPNQYDNTAIPFRNQRWVKNDPLLLEQVRLGYPMLRAHLADLKKQGMPIFDLTVLNSSLDWKAYYDPCCHLHPWALDVVAKAILNAIKGHYENSPAHRLPHQVLRPHLTGVDGARPARPSP